MKRHPVSPKLDVGGVAEEAKTGRQWPKLAQRTPKSTIMWIFSKFGFFSVVTGRTPAEVVVRARVRADLQALSDLAALDFSIVETPDRDYPFRAFVSRVLWSGVLARLGDEKLDYPNFKEAVGKRDHDRAMLYSRVWSTMAVGLAFGRDGLTRRAPEHWVVRIRSERNGGPWLVQSTQERTGAKTQALEFKTRATARKVARDLVGKLTVGRDTAELRDETAAGKAKP